MEGRIIGTFPYVVCRARKTVDKNQPLSVMLKRRRGGLLK
jgi:hypothetical protein